MKYALVRGDKLLHVTSSLYAICFKALGYRAKDKGRYRIIVGAMGRTFLDHDITDHVLNKTHINEFVGEMVLELEQGFMK